MSTLSILIPVYNEVHTIVPLVEKVKASKISIDKEILIADDGSTDGTRKLLENMMDDPALNIEFMDKNVGRGGVIKHLWKKLTGDIVIHQDADLEYDPNEYQGLLDPILDGSADAVYGSRFKGNIEKMRTLNNLGNRTMTIMSRMLYGIDISDLMTCYKMYKSTLMKDLNIQADGFNFESEFTARLAQRGARFKEAPISFIGRTFEEGKKIRSTDALYVIQKLISCKFNKA
ncbi:MAG: glycosyltransferase family 2 protein [Nitrospira sp.]|nr:glycosyltransferase family 2 protein [Nitrospira sp.]